MCHRYAPLSAFSPPLHAHRHCCGTRTGAPGKPIRRQGSTQSLKLPHRSSPNSNIVCPTPHARCVSPIVRTEIMYLSQVKRERKKMMQRFLEMPTYPSSPSRSLAINCLRALCQGTTIERRKKDVMALRESRGKLRQILETPEAASEEPPTPARGKAAIRATLRY